MCSMSKALTASFYYVAISIPKSLTLNIGLLRLLRIPKESNLMDYDALEKMQDKLMKKFKRRKKSNKHSYPILESKEVREKRKKEYSYYY